MPPHGRRRWSTLTLLLCLASLFVSTASAASAVVGIDLGTEYIKAALVKPGIPLEIVLTKDSKRKESSAVAFKPLRSKASSDPEAFPERAYGGDALALSARFPSDVYSNLKPLLGLPVGDDAIVAEYKARHPGLNVVKGKERGTVALKSESFGKQEEPFLVEEFLAMELQNIKSNAEALAGKGSRVQDAVITIPAFYTAEERRAVELAADLAGLRVLGLISDGLAVGLNYATSRTFPSINDGAKPEYHLVYDMGAGSTTATVLKFQGRIIKDVGKFNKTIQEVQVLGTGWDRTLGGDAFNMLIMQDMVEQFAATKRIQSLGATAENVMGDGRTVAKLWKESERVRQVLSANTETFSSFEGLYHEDVNFKYRISRNEFEKLATTYTERVEGPVQQALDSAKLTLADLESVILHGGAVRTPFVQKQLESIVGDAGKIRTNVNADEAAVFGAAFKAAGFSASFRVKDIRAADGAGYAFGATWVSDGKEHKQKLFTPASQTGVEKQVPFKVTEDFSMSLYQQTSGGETQPTDLPLVKVQTQNLTASVNKLVDTFGCKIADVSTKFTIRLSPHNGLPEVLRGSVSCEVSVLDKKGVVADVKGFFGFGSKKGSQEPLAAEDDIETPASPSEAESATTSSPVESTTPSSKFEDDTKDVKKRTETISLSLSTEMEGLPQISAGELKRIKTRLAAFDASDRSRILREEALNTLEAFTYKARDLISDEGFIAASTEQQRNLIEEKMKAASEWLYGDGADASREELKNWLKELRGLVDPIQKRKEEAIKRPEEIRLLKEQLDQTRAMADMIKEQSDMASKVAAASSASSASSSSSSSASEAQTTTPPDSDSDSDSDFADLEDDDLSSSSTTTTSSSSSRPSSAPPPKLPEMPTYTAEDIASLTRTYTSIQIWLDAQISAQAKLSPADDPVIRSEDLAAKSKELNKVIMELLQRKPKMLPPPPRPSKSAGKVKGSAAGGKKAEKGKGKGKSGDGKDGKDGSGGDEEFLEYLRGMSHEEILEMGRRGKAPGRKVPGREGEGGEDGMEKDGEGKDGERGAGMERERDEL